MNSKLSMVLIAALLALPLVGCDSNKGEESGEKAEAEQAAAEKTDEKAEEKEEEEEKITAAEFSEKLVPTACTALDTCKNEKLKAGASGMVMMAVGFGAMGDPDLAKKVKPVQDAMKKEERSALNKEECSTMLGIFTEKAGMNAETMEAKVGKTVEFYPEKAQKCLTQLESLEACNEEVKLEGEMKMKELQTVLKEAKFEQSLKVCDEVMTGMLAEGDECEYNWECKSEELKCQGPQDAKGEKAEGEEKAEVKKTCQKQKAPAMPGGAAPSGK